MDWFLALCGFSIAIGAFVEAEKVKKENENLDERIAILEDELYK